MFRALIVLLLIIAFLLQSVFVLLSTSLFYCLYYLYTDFRGLEIRRLDMSVFFSLGFLLNTISHVLAVTTDDPVQVRYFLLLYKPQHLFEGLALFCVGNIVISEVLRFFCRDMLPGLAQTDAERAPWWPIFIFSFFLFFINALLPKGALGAVSSVVGIMVHGSVLYLSFEAHLQQSRVRINLLLVYTIFLSFYAFKVSYLRYEIILPWVAYYFGELIARKRFAIFSTQSKVLFVVLMLLVPPLFTYLGKTRASGDPAHKRLEVVAENLSASGDDRGETILTRLSFINQVTNVVHLVNKKGFYEGKTLAYFSYAFIPRFVWPEKPLIKQGQWFAEEAGLAYRDKQGRVNNSINMTVPGEFYLNFGWAGVIVGCWFFGVFFAFIWNNVQGNSLASWAFRYNLLFGSMAGLGADLQVVVTLTAFFLMYQFYFWIHKHVRV